MKAIIFRVFDHFANSLANFCSLELLKVERKLKQSLGLSSLTREFVCLQVKIRISARVESHCEMFVV